MLRRLGMVAVATIALLVASGQIPAAADWAHKCYVLDFVDCKWVLTDNGVQPVVPPEQDLYVPDQSVPDPDPCRYTQIARQPDPDSVSWRGHDPKHGRLWQTWCPDALVIDRRNPDGSNVPVLRYMGTYYVPDGTAPGQDPTIDPMVLVRRATGSLTIPTPAPHFGPDSDKIAVKVPVWLWIDDPGPIVKTATAGTLSATVTASLVSTTWQMGEPVDVHDPSVPAAPVTCPGAGTAYRPGMDPAQPPCGYTYTWKSLPERTDGTGTWTVTVTAHWRITWTVSSGETGGQDITVTGTVPLRVREWHVVLVNKPGH